MASKSKKANTTNVKSPAKRSVSRAKYKSFRLQKKIKIKPQKPLSGAFSLMKGNIKHLWKYKRVFVGITAIYLVLSLLLVGVGGIKDFGDLKNTLGSANNLGSQLTQGLALFAYMLSGGVGGSSNPTAGIYQTVLMVIVSLVVIWSLRKTYAAEKVKVKQAFYSSMYPLIPFILVVLVIALQFLPLVISGSLYSIVIGQGLAVTNIEKALWLILVILGFILTLYMISSSLFALYIVTLPDINPMKALRSAREVVIHRRSAIMRKILFLPISLLLMGAIIMLPILLFFTVVANYVFVILGLFALVVGHGYMYRLYRELL